MLSSVKNIIIKLKTCSAGSTCSRNNSHLLFISVSILFINIFSVNGFSQWITQNSGTTNHLYDVYFINQQTGWACGENGTIVKTTNSGINWNSQNSFVTYPLQSIHFPDSLIGYCAAGFGYTIYKSTDSGNNWFVVLPTNKGFRAVYFINPITGWAAGTYNGGWLFRTTNGGINWDSTIVGGSGKDVYFINNLTGWFASGFEIYKSTDGGINWTFKYTTIGNGEIQEFYFGNQNTGWLITDTYKVFKTTDSGNNWSLISSIPGQVNAHYIYFSNLNTGWVTGDIGSLFSTTNGGYNWYQQQTNTNNFLSSVQFITDSIGWCVGGLGKIIHTNSMGQIVSTNNKKKVIVDNFVLYQNYPNPFNPITKLRFLIKSENSKVKSKILLVILNLLGQEVETIVNQELNPGEYEFEWNAEGFASGVYFYKLTFNNYSYTKKMILIK